MCGIYGFAGFPKRPFDQEALRSMGSVLAQRGPDDQGFYLDEFVALGHNRLSIIDLSKRGQQPMCNEDGTVWISFNGEIYNYKQLRNELKSRHQFKTETDTEVLIHGYEEFGERLWSRLEGMFAFAIWNVKTRQLFIVRDHFGIKPVFYNLSGNSITFASQIKALLRTHSSFPGYDLQGISNFFSYFFVPGPETAICGVRQLEPGHYLQFDQNGLSKRQYYRLSLNIASAHTEKHLVEEIPEKVRIAVDSSAVSDVPVGLLLSSGLDSSILRYEMLAASSENISTFTLGFSEHYPSFDESRQVEEMYSDRLSTLNVADFSIDCFAEEVDDIVLACDCFNANPGLHLIYQYMKLASGSTKVAMQGSGLDEMFAGYATYQADELLRRMRWMPVVVRRFIALLATKLPISYRKYSFDQLVKKFFEGSIFPPEKAHYWWRTIVSDENKISLFDQESFTNGQWVMDASYKYLEKFSEVEGTFQDRSLIADFHLFLTDNALLLADHIGMHFSLEVRPPFLHQRFVDFAFTIPFQYKLRNRTGKYIMRQAYQDCLPDRVLSKKKVGVVSPLGSLFRGPLRDYVVDTLTSDDMRSIAFINYQQVRHLITDHMDGKEDHGYILWCLIYLVRWDYLHRKIFK